MIQKILFMHFLRLYIELQFTVMYNKSVQAVNCKAMKKIYSETKSYIVDKNNVRNIDGKVYGDYVATITIDAGGRSCVELIVQDMSANESE